MFLSVLPSPKKKPWLFKLKHNIWSLLYNNIEEFRGSNLCSFFSPFTLRWLMNKSLSPSFFLIIIIVTIICIHCASKTNRTSLPIWSWHASVPGPSRCFTFFIVSVHSVLATSHKATYFSFSVYQYVDLFFFLFSLLRALCLPWKSDNANTPVAISLSQVVFTFGKWKI